MCLKSSNSPQMFYLLQNVYTWGSSLLFHCSLSFLVFFPSMSLPQLMFPGFLAENLQQGVQCATQEIKTHPSCFMSACSVTVQHTQITSSYMHVTDQPSYESPTYVPSPLIILIFLLYCVDFVLKAREDICKDDVLKSFTQKK